MEGADHVLAERVVDAGLAAHRRIHLRQQRGRHLDERHPAHIAGGGKPGHVAHHPAAQRHQRGLAVGAGLQQRVEDQVQRFPLLEGLAVGQRDRAHGLAERLQAGLDARCVQRPYGFIGDDDGVLAAHVRAQQFGVVQQAGTDMDGVAALAQVDFKRNHGLGSCAGGSDAPGGAEAGCGGSIGKPAISSCINTILASCATEGLPVSMMKSATSR
ncbi:hypothetical protein D3C72_1211150 [compost metagenome]